MRCSFSIVVCTKIKIYGTQQLTKMRCSFGIIIYTKLKDMTSYSLLICGVIWHSRLYQTKNLWHPKAYENALFLWHNCLYQTKNLWHPKAYEDAVFFWYNCLYQIKIYDTQKPTKMRCSFAIVIYTKLKDMKSYSLLICGVIWHSCLYQTKNLWHPKAYEDALFLWHSCLYQTKNLWHPKAYEDAVFLWHSCLYQTKNLWHPKA